MEKKMSLSPLLYALLTLITIFTTTSIECSSHSPENVKRLRFYVQDIVGGDNRTVWMVAKTNLSDTLPSRFGAILITDTPITAGPERDSQYLGQIQGIIAYTDKGHAAITVDVNVMFTEGEFKGSTLSLAGRNALNDEVREVSVVSGTGAFRFARGYVVTKTYAISQDKTKGVYQYDVVVLLPQFAQRI